MAKPKAKELRLSPRAAPAAKAVAQLCKTFREHRGWSMTRAAELLGITPIHYRALEAGKIIPGPAMSRRLRGWIVEKLSYEGAPPISEAPYTPENVKEWRLLRVPLEKPEAAKLRKKAQSLGMSLGAVGAIAIKQMLRSQQAWATLGRAVEDTRRALLVDAVRNVPELKDLLTVDAHVLTSDVPLRSFNQVEEQRPAIERLIETKLDLSAEESDVEVDEDA